MFKKRKYRVFVFLNSIFIGLKVFYSYCLTKNVFSTPTLLCYFCLICTLVNLVNGAFNNNFIKYESKRDKDKILTLNKYLDMIRSYLVDMINEHKTQSEWKIQLTIAINFISSKPDSDETRIMRTKTRNRNYDWQ